MSEFKKIFEQVLKETPLVKFIKQLKSKKVINKLIKIPKINTEFDGDELMVLFDGDSYSWFISDKYTRENDYKERSNDTFSNYSKCIENLVDVLKDRSFK